MSRHAAKRGARAGLGAVIGGVLGSVLAGVAMAATVSEADFGGDFSGDWRNSTQITGAPSLITGGWSGRDDVDFLSISGLLPGLQTMSITFTVPADVTPDSSYAAQGVVIHQTGVDRDGPYLDGPYRDGAWRDMRAGRARLSYRDLSDDVISLTFQTSPEGVLRLGLFGIRGRLSYSISGLTYGSSVVAVPPPGVSGVPLPAGAWLLISGLGALAAQRALRRR